MIFGIPKILFPPTPKKVPVSLQNVAQTILGFSFEFGTTRLDLTYGLEFNFLTIILLYVAHVLGFYYKG